jgi:adenosylcobinamide kinase/adenosylcobinamide-phosphate guanylyltransferase
LTFVIGGARSGKSRAAEALAVKSGLARSYIATAEAWDDEMRARIAAHKTNRGPNWHTIEAPRDLAGALSGLGGVVVIDCLTLWLTNVMLADGDVTAEVTSLITALALCPAKVIVVSNEVGWSIVPENALARRFRDEQGRLNQRVAESAGLVLAVIAGLPLALKGQMP